MNRGLSGPMERSDVGVVKARDEDGRDEQDLHRGKQLIELCGHSGGIENVPRHSLGVRVISEDVLSNEADDRVVAILSNRLKGFSCSSGLAGRHKPRTSHTKLSGDLT